MNEAIRLLNINDSEGFRTLRLNSLKEDPDSWLATYDEEKDLPNISFANKIQFAYSSPIFGFYGYFEANKLLAYAQLSSSYWNKKKHIVTLYDVCVSKDARRKAVGTRLINFIIEKAKTVPYIEQIQLRVNSRNPGAISFYEKLGFIKTAVFPESVKEIDGTYQEEYLYIYSI